jgi:hypothetical protein
MHDESIRVNAEDFARIIEANQRLNALVTELQTSGTELLERARRAEAELAVVKGMAR